MYAAMITRLFPPKVAPTLDRSVYNLGKGRMWRLPNRRRSDTGHYKVPLAMREVLHQPSAALEALTTRPRTGLFWPPEQELSPCPALVQVYQEAMATLEPSAPSSPPPDERTCIPTGQRNATLASLAGSMRRRGASEAAIAAALLAENRLRCEPPLPDEEIRRIAASITRYRPAAPGSATSSTGHRGTGPLGGIRTIAATEVMRWR
jgi:primase-like protein